MSWRVGRIFLLLLALCINFTLVLAEPMALWRWPVVVAWVSFVLAVIVSGGVEVSFSAGALAIFLEVFTSLDLGSDCVGSENEGGGGKIFHLDFVLFCFKFEYI